MQPGQPRLAIDYGTACARAVLAWPDGRWQPLTFDGAYELSTAVHTDPSGTLLVGAAAWQQAPTAPQGFVLSPLREAMAVRAGAGGGDLDDSPLVVAALARIRDQAQQVAGSLVEDVRMVHPAGWGPRARTWLRRAAYQAGLGQPRLVEAPVAAAGRLLAVGVQIPVDAFLLFVDLGAGCEASVLRRGPTGFELLATLADPAAGGDRIDDLLGAALLPAPPTPPQWWPMLARIRTAKQALAQQPAVTVPLPPPHPAVVVDSPLLAQAAEPVLHQAAQIAGQCVTNAELALEQLSGVYLIGGAAAQPAAAPVIGQQLGTNVQVMSQPGFAAVLGAAAAGGTAVTDPAPAVPQAPPLRRLVSFALPGLASLVLFTHFVLSANFENNTPGFPRSAYWVLATWGELATAATFALLTCLQAGALFGAALHHTPTQPPTPGPPTAAGSDTRIAAGIALATACGTAIAGLYAVLAAAYFALPVAEPLRWALLPILPLAVIAFGAAWLARQRRQPPPHGWDAFLAFPTTSVAAATAGTLLPAIWWGGQAPAALAGWTDLIGAAGGILLGGGIGYALAPTRLTRLILSTVLGLFGLLALNVTTTGTVAILYTIAVTLWWSHRLWTLARPTHAGDGHAR